MTQRRVSKKQFGQYLRRNKTVSEIKTERILRKMGIPFNSQVRIGPYFADIVGQNRNFILEIDGPIHDNSLAQAYDQRRTNHLNRLGYIVYRIKNEEVNFRNLRFLFELPLDKHYQVKPWKFYKRHPSPTRTNTRYNIEHLLLTKIKKRKSCLVFTS